MGEKDVESAEPKSVTNGNVEMEENTEPVSVMKKTEKHHDGATEMEEENKVAEEVENNSMAKEKVNDSKETEEKAKNEDLVKEGGNDERMEETKEEEEKQQVAEEKVDMEIEEMNHGPTEKTKADAKDGDKVDGVGEEEKPKESKEERSLKNRLRTRSGDGKKERSLKHETEDKESNIQKEKKTKETKTSTDKKDEQKTPVALTNDRPVRERKSVERLVAVIEQDGTKEFKVEKGRGTALKDIPNVAYKLSKKKSDDTFKLLHTILFGRRGKAAQVKNNISRFSGFAWHDDEEKQTLKLKEKLDKIFRDKLVEFCDVLDIPILATIRKEDIISKLIEFLVVPHATTTELLAEKEQSSKGKKRKRESKSGSSTLSESTVKSQKRTKGTPKKGSETTPEDEETYDEDDKNNGSERSEDEKSEPAEHEEKANECEGSDKDKRKKKQGSAKSSAKKGTAEKTKTKKVTISKETNLPPKKEPSKSPSSRPKNNKDTSSTKRSSGKKKDESIKEKTSTPETASSTVSPGKKILKVKDKLREEKLKPSDDELRKAISEILKEVDFNTATFTDILKMLAKRFNKDLILRKTSIKLMIQDELTKIADAEAADDEKDEGGVVKDGKKPS